MCYFGVYPHSHHLDLNFHQLLQQHSLNYRHLILWEDHRCCIIQEVSKIGYPRTPYLHPIESPSHLYVSGLEVPSRVSPWCQLCQSSSCFFWFFVFPRLCWEPCLWKVLGLHRRHRFQCWELWNLFSLLLGLHFRNQANPWEGCRAHGSKSPPIWWSTDYRTCSIYFQTLVWHILRPLQFSIW